MERVNTVYLVSVISPYPDCDSFKVFSDFKRAVEAFKARIGENVLAALASYEGEGHENVWDCLREWNDYTYMEDFSDECGCGIPSDAKDFIAKNRGVIYFNLRENERIELRAIEEVS